MKLSRQKRISKKLLHRHMDLRQFKRMRDVLNLYNYSIFYWMFCNYMPSIMRPDPPDSVVDYDYFLDIWTSVTFLISPMIRAQLISHRGPGTVSGAMQPIADIPVLFYHQNIAKKTNDKENNSEEIKSPIKISRRRTFT